MDDVRARIKRAAQLAADHGGHPDFVAAPADMIESMDCSDVMHVYPGSVAGTACKCGRQALPEVRGKLAAVFGVSDEEMDAPISLALRQP